MFSIVQEAYAMGSGGGGGDSMAAISQLAPFVLIFLIFYFLMIRPQQKKAKAHRQLLAALKKGDNVKTDGGIRGTIQKVDEDHVMLEIAHKVVVQIDRPRVQTIIHSKHAPEPTPKKDKKEEKGD